MSKYPGGSRIGPAARASRAKKAAYPQTRRLGFESLEQRRLLSSVGLNAISNVTLPAGTSVLVALNGSDPTSGKTVNFGVTTSNPSDVTPTVMPRTNKSVEFSINGLGTMTFELFDNLTPKTATWIENLVDDGFYNGDYVYRAETGSFALIQGGNNPPQINSGADVNPWPSSFGSTTTIDEEFNPDLDYTSAGSLAMARTSTANTSSSEFFVTDGATRSLDYGYTLFGFQTVNQAITYNKQSTTVLQALDSMPTTANSQGIHYLNSPVKITSASIITDTQNGVLMLRAPKGVTGTFTVTVTAFDDGTNTPTTRTFTVNVVADTATGQTTNPWASDTPAAPTSIGFLPSGQGTSNYTTSNNSSTSKELQFLVSGATVGDLVTLYADGIAIGSITATSTSQVVSTNGSTTLLSGMHTFTATQTAQNVAVTDAGDSSLSESANVDSFSSPAVQLQVFTSLALTSTPATSAKVGQTYTYTVQTNAPSGDAFGVTPGSMPTGMQYNATTHTFTWTPTTNQANTSPTFSATVTDSLAHTVSIGPVNISVVPGLGVVQIPTNTSLGGNVTVSFSGNQVKVYNNIAKAVLSTLTFNSTDIVTIDCPAGQANTVSVALPNSSSAPLPQEVFVQGLSGSTNNQVTVVGTIGTNTFTLAGNTVTANGLATQIAAVQKLALNGSSGNSYYTLNSSSVPVSVIDTGGYNTLDFSHDTAGVHVNLGLNKGQAQSIAPWNTTLAIAGVINKLVGTAYADVLTGGPAATTEIVGGAGNDTITGGSGDNILLGGGGTDTITGGAGKNLIIGGSGNSNLYAQGTQNIIFAGTTNEDSNDQAVLNLLDQGSRLMYGYSARRLLASARNSTMLSSPTVSFQDVGAHDTIFGSGVNDWCVLGKYTTVKG
jgi:cyclophilin family peptidyl-prolyl cis-trans isomerase/Ca2+-binding RTX toxin-like protein